MRWDLFFRPLPLAFVSAVVLVTLAAGLLWRRRGRGFVPGPEAFGAGEGGRSTLYGLLPAILGVHVAVPLLFNGVQGNLFSPDNVMPSPWSNFLGLFETGVALSLFYGGFARIAAGGLAALWLAGVPLLGLQPMLDNALFLGFAAFFFLAGRGPVSVDRLLFPRLEPPERFARYAVPALRVGLGLSFVFVAFTEKFANLPLAQTFLDRYPLNFTGALGLPLPDEVFILCAGSVELMVGLFLTLGIFPRETVIFALVPVNLTLTVFNYTELLGHLPIYGVLALLLIWEPGRKNLALWLRGLREGPRTSLSTDDAKT
ncbi:DoxX protein [Rubrobacter marinus]|uniref:DoxX protein n=1 Tax=Rubrobacter marinus TaxID=2653852 RepID=A0A6G8PS71_9ACTN|nr:DoxX protein [Rubrobacter marinus]QIN77329.1 DoxX protein [Rubrobacter marinus]